MDTTWAEEIERSFGDGPTPPPPATYVEAGRAVVRRRRLAVGVASVAAALVIGGVGWAALPGEPGADAGQVATDPSPTAAGTPSPSPTAEVSPLVESATRVRVARTDDEMVVLGREGLAVGPLDDGTLVRRPGWTVERLVVLEDLARHKAWGVELARDDGTAGQWAIASWSADGSTSVSYEEPGKRFAVFDDWIRDRWAQEQVWEGSSGDAAGAPLVAKVVDGEVVVDDGVVLLEVVMRPAEAEAYGPVGEQAAVRLRLTDGTVMFGRVDALGTTTVDPAVLDAPTMPAFLRHLQAQGDSGEGLR